MKKPSSNKKYSVFLLLVPILIGLVLVFTTLIKQGNMQLLQPAGYIADVQSHILWAAIVFGGTAASTIIITFYSVIFHYREDHHAQYEPTWNASRRLLLAGWGVPLLVIAVISTFLWATAHQVDPYKPIASTAKPITIQVVALQWKWLFIYPNDRIATVNMLELPVDTPVSLQLTSDAPMNSFWIPRLSGQIYAMTGMVTKLHIEANKTGTYTGSPAEMSGADFAGMDFDVHVVPYDEYATWKASSKKATQSMDYANFARLAKPSGYLPQATYALPYSNLFDLIVMQYMAPGVDPSQLRLEGATT